MSEELTPWFPESVRPAYVGHYQRDYGFGAEDVPDYWDGKHWWVCPVYNPSLLIAGSPTLPWRGLAKKL